MLYQKYHNTLTKLKQQDLWEKPVKSNLSADRSFSDRSIFNSPRTIETDGNMHFLYSYTDLH